MKPISLAAILIFALLSACTQQSVRTEPAPISNEQKAVLYSHRIGESYYVNQADKPEIFDAKGQRDTTFLMRVKVKGLVWGKNIPFYTVRIDDNRDGLIRADTLKTSQLEVVPAWLRKEREQEAMQALKREKEQAEAERKAAEEKAFNDAATARIAELEALLKESKITPGTPLYFQSLYDGYPGLMKVIYKSLRLEKDKSSNDLNSARIFMVFSMADGKSFEKILFSPGANKAEINERINDIFYRKLPNWGVARIKDIQNGYVVMGMTKEQLVASWGEPHHVNRNVGRWGTHEQWVYGSRNYVYFENGHVTSWQN